MITVVIPSVLNGGGGQKKLEVEAATPEEAIKAVSAQLGDDFERRVFEGGKVRSLINVYINGKNAKFSGGLESKLADGDELYILPAVSGGSLSEEETDRYSRQIMLDDIGYAGQLKLRDSKVCLVGVGGLGNPVASRLVAMGVGTIRLVDRDVIELSNLHRQIIFAEADVGKIKVEAAASALRKLNSHVKIEELAISVNEYTAPDVIEGCDVVIDALDGVAARYALNEACVKKGIPLVMGSAVGAWGQVLTVVKNSPCYTCRFPDLDDDTMPTCSIEGVNPPILSIVGALEVSEAVKILLGKKPGLAGRILTVDLGGPDFEYAKLARAPECPVCGSGVRKPHAKEPLIIEELCGRARGKRTFSLTPTVTADLNLDRITDAARQGGYEVTRHGLGLSLSGQEKTVSFMRHGSAVLVGPKDEKEAIDIYNSLVNAA